MADRDSSGEPVVEGAHSQFIAASPRLVWPRRTLRNARYDR